MIPAWISIDGTRIKFASPPDCHSVISVERESELMANGITRAPAAIRFSTKTGHFWVITGQGAISQSKLK